MIKWKSLQKRHSLKMLKFSTKHRLGPLNNADRMNISHFHLLQPLNDQLRSVILPEEKCLLKRSTRRQLHCSDNNTVAWHRSIKTRWNVSTSFPYYSERFSEASSSVSVRVQRAPGLRLVASPRHTQQLTSSRDVHFFWIDEFSQKERIDTKFLFYKEISNFGSTLHSMFE